MKWFLGQFGFAVLIMDWNILRSSVTYHIFAFIQMKRSVYMESANHLGSSNSSICLPFAVMNSWTTFSTKKILWVLLNRFTMAHWRSKQHLTEPNLYLENSETVDDLNCLPEYQCLWCFHDIFKTKIWHTDFPSEWYIGSLQIC